MARAKNRPVPVSPRSKDRPVVPGSLAPGSGKPIIPRKLAGIHTAPLDDDLHHPVWRLSLLDRDHAGSWSWQIDESTLVTIVEFLTSMERLSWKEIRAQTASGARRTLPRHHFQAVSTLCDEAQDRLSKLGLDDWDELFRFRAGGQRGRLWGILSNDSPRVFYPIWWDAEHLVYPIDRD
jgi:hypothetical protein